MTDMAWVTLGGFLTLIATQVFKMVIDSRNRKWDLEDRASLRDATLAAANKVEHSVQSQNKNLAISQAQATAERAQASIERSHTNILVKEVGEHAKAAYHEANTVNEKLKEMSATKNDQITKIEDTTDRIEASTKEIQSKLDHDPSFE